MKDATVLVLVCQMRAILGGLDSYLMAAFCRRWWRHVGDLIVVQAVQANEAFVGRCVIPVNVRVLVRCAPESHGSRGVLKVHAQIVLTNSGVRNPIDAFDLLFLAIFK